MGRCVPTFQAIIETRLTQRVLIKFCIGVYFKSYCTKLNFDAYCSVQALSYLA